jgi:threonine/homoserine/homoserine lactone efflux protein
MISAPLFLAFVAATVALIAMPGPNVALIVGNTIARGRRVGFATVAGTASAMVVQLGLTVAGMTAVVALFGHVFEVLRIAGVAYLLLLAWRAWHAPAPGGAAMVDDRPLARIVAGGFFVSLTNPKTLLFYGAFLPQFVAADRPALPQLLLLAGTFMALAVAGDTLWVLAAARLGGAFRSAGRLGNRVAAGVFALAGLGLALTRRP